MRNENGSFAGKVAFVTGAANGIGRAAALAFARESANVVVSDISEQGNQETARMIEELGGRALAVRCDVTPAEDVKVALDEGVEAFGHLDFAFNNAGSEQAITATADLTEDEWDRIVRVNLRDREHLLGRRGQRHRGSGRILRREIRHRRPHEGGGPRLREVEYPRERRVPRHHRHTDDGPLQRGHPRRTRAGNRAGAGRPDGKAGGNRRGRRLAMFGRGRLRRRARHGHRWWPDGVANAVVPASFTYRSPTSS
jgi:NAD(P)-dependent dehydrogenase (short-subunit alcohol dehydrogenase family)